jgi:hypothetical protein
VHHAGFEQLFSLVKAARNDAAHQGVYARHLTRHAIQLAIVLEDALMAEHHTVADFMIRTPVVAELWQPLSFVRQSMIENSFTYLPVLRDGEWRLLSDEALAAACRGAPAPVSNAERARRLALSVEEALNAGLLTLVEPGVLAVPSDSVSSVLARGPGGRMVLVIERVDATAVSSPGNRAPKSRLLGILMPFDVL